MKKIVMFLFTFYLVFGINVNTFADEIVKSITVNCGGLEQKIESTGITARFNTRSNVCNVAVDLADGYQIVTENYQKVTLNEGDNVYKLTVRGANGQEHNYNYNIKYNAYSSNSSGNTATDNKVSENPSTGDQTIFYIVSGIAVLTVIGISLNRIKKYSDVR